MEFSIPVRSEEHRKVLRARVDEKSYPDRPSDLSEAWRFDFRTRGMHDRDKVLYSEAFQRLAQITQVTAPEGGYVFHNRLSHSLKVAQIGRRLTERLQRVAKDGFLNGAAATAIEDLDVDVIEAGCLAHDLGHPPFGHIAEQELQRLTDPVRRDGKVLAPGLPGRFEGNAQSFRIAVQIEQTAAGNGFNLTRQTLETLLKYPWRRAETDDGTDRQKKWGYYDSESEQFEWVREFAPVDPDARGEPALEARIMDWADDLTYAVHDVEDFYCAGLIPLHRLTSMSVDGASNAVGALKDFEHAMEEAQRGRKAGEFTPGQLAGALEGLARDLLVWPLAPYDGSDIQRQQLRAFGSALITKFFSAFVLENRGNGGVVLKIDDQARLEAEALKALVSVFVIQRPSMAEVQHGQRRIVADLFEHYLEVVDGAEGDLRTLPPAYRIRLRDECKSGDDRKRLVVDLISGLTEEAAYRIHRRLSGGTRDSVLV